MVIYVLSGTKRRDPKDILSVCALILRVLQNLTSRFVQTGSIIKFTVVLFFDGLDHMIGIFIIWRWNAELLAHSHDRP